jgi:small subunit ribosomal protein S21
MYTTQKKEIKVKIDVRNNNVDKAMRILKKKLTEDGFFNELRQREYYESKGTKRRKAKAAAKRRSERDLKKRMEEQGY